VNNIEVELENGFEHYWLPDPGTAEELAEAVRLSWEFLEVAPLKITAPLLGLAYAAPLAEIISPDFVVWLWGETGSFKSTVSALTLSHYGGFDDTRLPFSFESTSNALERSLFLAKDILTVVDDWRPGVTRGDSDDMDRKAQRLLRGVGNRQGRNRMTSDTMLRESYPPRGAVMATAEALPEGPAFQSASARALCVNIAHEQVDREKLSRIQAQKEKLPQAMAGYIRFIGARYDALASELPKMRDSLREKKLRPLLGGSHPRTPGNTATLILGLQQLRDFSVSIGAINEAEVQELYERARTGILEAAKAHTESTTGGDPASRFVDLLRSLFDAGHVYASDRRTGGIPQEPEQLGWEESDREDSATHVPCRNADHIGAADEEYLYLDKNTAFKAIGEFAQRGGLPFGVKPRMVWESLARAGHSLTDEDRTDTSVKVAGKTKRMVQIPRSVVFGPDDEGAE
jgi:hypothetical protein